MLLSPEDAREFVRAAISKNPDWDPIDVAFEMGRMAGHESAAWMVAQGLRSALDHEINRDFVRHMLAHVCDAADEGAMKFAPSGAEIPSREMRLATREWL